MDTSSPSTSTQDDSRDAYIEPPNKKMRINPYLRDELQQENVLKLMNVLYTNDNYFQIKQEPFRHMIIDDIIKDTEVLEKFVENLDQIPLEENSSDLFRFSQSHNLFTIDEKNKYLQTILDFLKNDCPPLLHSLTGLEIEGKIIATLSVYEKNDYLLCHDDLSGDRLFAYILYLNKEWDSKDGGQLQLFSHDEHGYPNQAITNYFPKFNRMIFFEVTSTSYHQVKEIIGDSKRISINGWFHGKINPHKKVDFKQVPAISSFRPYTMKKKSEILKDFINIIYLDLSNLEEIRRTIIKQSAVNLEDFFVPETFNKIKQSLESKNLNWQKYGPSNHRNCLKIQVNDCPSYLFELISLFHSPQFIIYLEDMCKMTIHRTPERLEEQILFHIYKWVPGTYTLVHDFDSESKKMSLDAIVFFLDEEFEEKHGGTIHYIARDVEEQLANIVPVNNSLSIVIRDPDTTRFTKYLNSLQKTFYYMSVTYTDVDVPDATSSSSSETDSD